MAELKTNNIFTNLLKFSRDNYIDRSSKWIQEKAKNITKDISNTQEKIFRLEQERKTKIPYPGKMYFFRYDPKTKEKLPFYDTFPLIFCVKPLPDGFYGLNFHYLPPTARGKLMDSLYTLVSDQRMDENTRLMISYNILKSTTRFKEFSPCFKRYLYKHVRSNLIEIYSNEWEVALFLPVGKFEKANKNKVYADSRKIIQNL